MSGRLILYFGIQLLRDYGARDEWEIGTEFVAAGNTFIYVEYSPRYNSVKNQKGVLSYFQSFFGHRIQRIASRLFMLTSPPMLPLFIPLLSRIWPEQIASLSLRLNKVIHAYMVKQELNRLSLHPDVIVFTVPWDVHLVGRFGEKVIVYRPVDEVGMFPINAGIVELIEELEVEASHRADLVFPTSISQYHKRKGLNSNTYLVPHGVNFERLRAAAPSASCHKELKKIRRPIIGFVGGIDWRIDLCLIKEITLKCPEWSWVFVGPIKLPGEKIDEIASLPNVCFLGPKDFEAIPSYILKFDVCIIPYAVTPATNTMRFYKLGEYLACGKPIVSTDCYETRAFDDLISIARSAEEFIALVEESMRTDCEQKVKSRIEWARQNDWKKRVAFMLSKIEEELALDDYIRKGF